MKKFSSVVSLIGLAFGALGALRELKEAHGKRDNLALANAVCNAAAVVTGAALAIRGIRSGSKEDDHA